MNPTNGNGNGKRNALLAGSGALATLLVGVLTPVLMLFPRLTALETRQAYLEKLPEQIAQARIEMENLRLEVHDCRAEIRQLKAALDRKPGS